MPKFLTNILIYFSKIHSRNGLYPFLLEEFNAISPRSDVLNIGAGGVVEAMLYDRTKGKEIKIASLDIDPNREPDIVADIHSWNSVAKYDIIVMSEVLEHCHSPHEAIAAIMRALRPSGMLILTTPFIFPIHDAPNDYFRFTRYGIRHLLTEFNEIKIRDRNLWSESIIVLLVRLVMDDSIIVRLASPIFILAAYCIWPFAWVVARMLPTRSMTTGYCVTAKKGN